jgi:predicted metal-dependent hydrolase
MNPPDNDNYLELATPAGDKIKVLRAAHPRARRLRLTVTSGGARVSYPSGTHPAQVFAFLRQHANWLERKLDELQIEDQPPALEPGRPTLIPLRGETTRLVWRDGAFPHIELEDERIILTLPKPHNKRTLIAARALLHSYLQAQIRRDVSRHLARYVPELGRAPTRVRVKPLKSLWGSLDTRDAITLDLALALGRDPRAVPSALSRSFAAILGACRFALPRLARAARLAQGARARAEGRTRSSDQVVRPRSDSAPRLSDAWFARIPVDRRIAGRRAQARCRNSIVASATGCGFSRCR